MSLINGRIPAYTECPFKNKCDIVKSCCHKGIEHTVEFSCAAARLYNMVYNRK